MGVYEEPRQATDNEVQLAIDWFKETALFNKISDKPYPNLPIHISFTKEQKGLIRKSSIEYNADAIISFMKIREEILRFVILGDPPNYLLPNSRQKI